MWTFRQSCHFLIDFATKTVRFCEKSLFHFEPFKYCLQRILCSDFRNQLLFSCYENQQFLKNLVSYLASAQSARTKMTAIWFSSYELFVKIDTFQFTLRLKVSIFVKNHFFILSHLKIVFKGFCVPTPEASCSSYFMKTNIFWKSWSHMWAQAKPLGRKWPQFDSLVMNFSSKWTLLNWLCDKKCNFFLWKNTFSFTDF